MLPVKGIKLMIISVLLASLMMPFTVFADDYSGSTIQGFNVSLIDVEQVLVQSGGTSGYMGKYIYEVEFILDDSYVGYINVSGEIKFYPYNSSTLTTYSLPGRNYFVNGTSFKLTFQLTGDGYTADNRPSLNNTVFTYGNHNLYKHSEIDSLETIIDLLTDLYNNTDTIEGLLNNQLTQLQLIANRCNISNQYLEQLTKIKQWNIPFESYQYVLYFLNKGYEFNDIFSINYLNYPVFNIDSNDLIAEFSSTSSLGNIRHEYTMIFGWFSGVSTLSSLPNFLTLDDGEFTSCTPISFIRTGPNSSNFIYILKVTIGNFTTTGSAVYNKITFSYPNVSNLKFIPIYFNVSSFDSLSTDFALQFGLSNKLLDNLNIIAQGTTQSNQSASDLQGNTSDFETAADQYYTIENTYNNNMNTQLQNIDTSTGLSGFGGNFLTSANWVRVQFNNLTNANPFGSLVTYGLTLGLALLLLGKVFL